MSNWIKNTLCDLSAENLSGTARDATATTIYDRLIDFKQGTTELEPALAERWTVSADRTTYDFELRRGVKFHSQRSLRGVQGDNLRDVLTRLPNLTNQQTVEVTPESWAKAQKAQQPTTKAS